MISLHGGGTMENFDRGADLRYFLTLAGQKMGVSEMAQQDG